MKIQLHILYFFLMAEFCVVFLGLTIFFFIRSRKYKKLYLQEVAHPGASSAALAERGKKGTPETPLFKSGPVRNPPPKEKAAEGEKGKEPPEKEKGK